MLVWWAARRACVEGGSPLEADPMIGNLENNADEWPLDAFE